MTLAIDRQEYRGWDELEVHLGLDSHPSVGFRAPFDPEDKAFRERFRPFSFKPLELKIGGELAFTGRLVEANPDLSAGKVECTISAYSLAAQLEDSDVPASLIPMEAANLSLTNIATTLAAPFGVSVVMDGPEGAAFKRVKTKQRRVDGKVEADQKIQDFLGELARQRGLVMTSTPAGDLRFWQSVKPGRPVANFKQGEQPLMKVDVSFTPREYYSEITGFTNTKRGVVGAKYTERNQRLSGGVVRALNFKLDDIEKGDGPAAVRAKMGRMFANMVAYTAHVPTWRDPQGALWAPNTTVTLLAPGAMVYTRTELLVRDVILRRSKDEGLTASLGLVLPGAFSGQAPSKMPWDEA